MTHTFTSSVRLALFALLLTLAFGASAQVERGQKSFGPRVGYITKNNSALVGLNFDYAFSSHVRIAPAIGLVFRNEDRDALLIDVDMHFPIATSARSGFYPLVGAAFNSWAYHEIDEETHDDVITRKERFWPQRRCRLGDPYHRSSTIGHRSKIHPYSS